MSQDDEDPEIAIIKARKMKKLKEKAALNEKIKEVETKMTATKTNDKEIVLKYLYDRGDEVLRLAESQYPIQTEIIVKRIADLIKSREIDSLISGGELLSIFRSVGLRVRVDTNIRIEDHGKFISFGEKLKEGI
jgi:DNA-binding TFAR19-related protein (PDSD5 family)